MNEHYNRQFLQIDFASLEAPEFFRFLQKAEFGAYLILRRYVWRSTTPHPLGLQGYYWDKQLLVAAVENDLIARKMGIRDVTRVSKYHKSLEDFGVIQRLRTGRANIFILGEWIDISEGKDKSKRLEWFYFDRKFGASIRTPRAAIVTTSLTIQAGKKGAIQTWRFEPSLICKKHQIRIQRLGSKRQLRLGRMSQVIS
jgi:hypothetical protein